MRTWYSDYLKNPSDSARRTLATELQNELDALETRSRAGEDTKALNDAIGTLDVRMREFITPDVAHELQQGAEAAGTVKPGQQFLSRDAVSRLLTMFNIDEVRALTGTEGLARHEAETIRKFADAPKEFLLEAKKLGLIDTITAGGEPGARAVDFLGRATRIREVHGVRYEGGRFDLAELHAAFERGDAVLSHGPLQTPEFLEDIVGSRVELENGKLDVGTSKGRMPRSVMNPRGVPSPSPIAALDFVIIETKGTYKLMLGRHHSGLSGGRASVFAAGEIRFNDKGIVVELANASGHYLPSPGNLDRAVKFMYDRGLLSRSNPVRLDYIE